MENHFHPAERGGCDCRECSCTRSCAGDYSNRIAVCGLFELNILSFALFLLNWRVFTGRLKYQAAIFAGDSQHVRKGRLRSYDRLTPFHFSLFQPLETVSRLYAKLSSPAASCSFTVSIRTRRVTVPQMSPVFFVVAPSVCFQVDLKINLTDVFACPALWVVCSHPTSCNKYINCVFVYVGLQSLRQMGRSKATPTLICFLITRVLYEGGCVCLLRNHKNVFLKQRLLICSHTFFFSFF